MTATWIPCDYCDEYLCTIHGGHASECDCPPIDEWGDIDPYSESTNKQGRNMNVEFEYILGGNLTLEVEADITFGLPAKLDALPEDCYPAEDDEVQINSVTFFDRVSKFPAKFERTDFEIDDIVVAGQSLLDELIAAALEKAANELR